MPIQRVLDLSADATVVQRFNPSNTQAMLWRWNVDYVAICHLAGREGLNLKSGCTTVDIVGLAACIGRGCRNDIVVPVEPGDVYRGVYPHAAEELRFLGNQIAIQIIEANGARSTNQCEWRMEKVVGNDALWIRGYVELFDFKSMRPRSLPVVPGVQDEKFVELLEHSKFIMNDDDAGYWQMSVELPGSSKNKPVLR